MIKGLCTPDHHSGPICEVRHSCWTQGLVCNQPSNSSQRSWVQALGPATSVIPHQPHPVMSLWSSLCAQGQSSWRRKGFFPNYCHKVWRIWQSKMYLYTVALAPFTGSKRHLRNNPHPKLYCWHYAFQLLIFFWFPPNSDSSIRVPDSKAWYITPKSAFSLFWSLVVGMLCRPVAHTWHCA